MQEDIKGKFQWWQYSLKNEPLMQNSYQIFLVICNPFFVEVPPEKETDFTLAPQKIRKGKTKNKKNPVKLKQLVS